MAHEPRKSELIAELARARDKASVNLLGLSADLDVKHRLQTSFERNRLPWIGGASLLGFILAKLPVRRRKVAVKRGSSPASEKGAERGAVKAGLLITALKLGFDVVRPALLKWVTGQVAQYAESRFNRGPQR